jgi:hypothetical protein
MYVDIYTLKILPADARVLIDGRAPDTEPDGTVLLGFGSHNLEASKPGFVLRTLVVNVRGGERKELAMTLERKPVRWLGQARRAAPRRARHHPLLNRFTNRRPRKAFAGPRRVEIQAPSGSSLLAALRCFLGAPVPFG